jgi:hypothetical protein
MGLQSLVAWGEEASNLKFAIVDGAAVESDITLAGIDIRDVIIGAVNLTDGANIPGTPTKAYNGTWGTSAFDSILEAHTAGSGGNQWEVALVGDSVVGVKASKTFTGAYNAVLEATTAGVAGNSITVRLIGDSAGAAGVSIVRTGSAFVIHYESGVSTVGNVNTAIQALSGADDLVGVKTAGTTATVLTQPTDNVAVTALAGGVDHGGVTISIVNTYAVKTMTIHYESGVSTIGNIETAITALSGANDVIDVKTGGTGATVLTAPAGNVALTSLDDGADAIELPVVTEAGKIQFLNAGCASKKVLVMYVKHN